MQRRALLAATASGVTVGLVGCADADAEDEATALGETLRIATTTSTYDTGLLDEVNAAFEGRFGVVVETIAQGTGAALATARAGDADVVVVHARSLEDAFLREGYGVNRRSLMFNDFVVVGPDADPAGVDGTAGVIEAFQTIADGQVTFVSRGDNSGTHRKELAIWDAAGVEPGGEWYREAGGGMGAVLNQANQTPAYALTDRGTFLSRRSELDIDIRVQGPIKGGPELLANPYGIVAVNPGVHETVNYDLAMAYIGFVSSPEGQAVIEGHTVDGEQLFFPEAVSEDPTFEQYVPEGWSPDEE
ncbi:MAG: substrate-binding domain-containing protein [Halorubrum sp.]